jgi:hypothetical protein
MPSKQRKGRWQAFDALEGYQTSLRNVEYNRGKIEKQMLLPDKIEELNYILGRAIEEELEVTVHYYKNGYEEVVSGKIDKIDVINKELRINYVTIKLNMILDVKEA